MKSVQRGKRGLLLIGLIIFSAYALGVGVSPNSAKVEVAKQQGKEIPICTEPHNQEGPHIYGNRIVWVDWRNGNYDIYVNGDIYMYDLEQKKEIPICTAPHNQESPAIYGNRIVWEDWRNGNADIYMYDLDQKKEIPICTDPDWQDAPAIYGNRIVWVDWRNGNWDIYMYDLSTPSIFKLVDKSQASPGETLTYTISCWNEGTENLSNITISDTIPQQAEYVSGSATGNPTYDTSKRTLTWQIASLNAGSETKVSFKVKVLGGEKISNKATFGSCVVLTPNKLWWRRKTEHELDSVNGAEGYKLYWKGENETTSHFLAEVSSQSHTHTIPKDFYALDITYFVSAIVKGTEGDEEEVSAPAPPPPSPF